MHHAAGQGSEDDHLNCSSCGAKWHHICILGAFPLDLLFWYCGNCCALDTHDPAMNFALLMLPTNYDVDALIKETDYKVYKQVAPFMTLFIIIKGRLYHHVLVNF